MKLRMPTEKERATALICITAVILLVVIFTHFFKGKTFTSDLNTPPSEYIPNGDMGEVLDHIFRDTEQLHLTSVLPEVGFKTEIKEYPKLIWGDKTIKEETPRVGIDIKYPEFMGGKSVEKLNSYIANLVNGIVEEDRDKLKEMVFEFPDSYDSMIALSSRYRVIGVNNGIVSLELIVIDYTGGGNGDHSQPYTINWDLKSNRVLDNDELFCSKDYREKLMPIVRKQIISDFEQSTNFPKPLDGSIIHEIDDGTTSSADNWKYFLINNGGLIAVFPAYQVTSGASGIIRTYIPKEKVSNILCLGTKDSTNNTSSPVINNTRNYCKSDSECSCKNFDGANFIPGSTPGQCDLKSNTCMTCYYR